MPAVASPISPEDEAVILIRTKNIKWSLNIFFQRRFPTFFQQGPDSSDEELQAELAELGSSSGHKAQTKPEAWDVTGRHEQFSTL